MLCFILIKYFTPYCYNIFLIPSIPFHEIDEMKKKNKVFVFLWNEMSGMLVCFLLFMRVIGCATTNFVCEWSRGWCCWFVFVDFGLVMGGGTANGSAQKKQTKQQTNHNLRMEWINLTKANSGMNLKKSNEWSYCGRRIDEWNGAPSG